MKQATLLGCIESMTGNIIRARFYYMAEGEVQDAYRKGEARDVTRELCSTIEQYNKRVKKTHPHRIIPYAYQNGQAVYAYGCGLSHYLQVERFKEIAKESEPPLSFPLEECRLAMYTPLDVETLLA